MSFQSQDPIKGVRMKQQFTQYQNQSYRLESLLLNKNNPKCFSVIFMMTKKLNCSNYNFSSGIVPLFRVNFVGRVLEWLKDK